MPGIGWLMIAVPPIYFVLPRNPIGDDVVLINWIGAWWQENFEEEDMRRKGRDVSIAQEYRGPKSQVSKKEMANKRGRKGQAAKAVGQ